METECIPVMNQDGSYGIVVGAKYLTSVLSVDVVDTRAIPSKYYLVSSERSEEIVSQVGYISGDRCLVKLRATWEKDNEKKQRTILCDITKLLSEKIPYSEQFMGKLVEALSDKTIEVYSYKKKNLPKAVWKVSFREIVEYLFEADLLNESIKEDYMNLVLNVKRDEQEDESL